MRKKDECRILPDCWVPKGKIRVGSDEERSLESATGVEGKQTRTGDTRAGEPKKTLFTGGESGLRTETLLRYLGRRPCGLLRNVS